MGVCIRCNGTRCCKRCGGIGITRDNESTDSVIVFGRNEPQICKDCTGDGECRKCKGTGYDDDGPPPPAKRVDMPRTIPLAE